MDPVKSRIRFLGFWLLWTIATAISWLLIVYPGLNFRDLMFSSWRLIPEVTWMIFLVALGLGLLVGALQYLILRFYKTISFMWIVISALSYSFGSALAFLLSVSLIGIRFPSALSGGKVTFFPMPLDFTMFFSGGLSGLIQVFVLNGYFVTNHKRKLLLWVFGGALAWGFGFVATALAWGENLPINVQSCLGGVVIGAITGLILLALFKDEPFEQVQVAKTS